MHVMIIVFLKTKKLCISLINSIASANVIVTNILDYCNYLFPQYWTLGYSHLSLLALESCPILHNCKGMYFIIYKALSCLHF